MLLSQEGREHLCRFEGSSSLGADLICGGHWHFQQDLVLGPDGHVPSPCGGIYMYYILYILYICIYIYMYILYMYMYIILYTHPFHQFSTDNLATSTSKGVGAGVALVHPASRYW